MGFVLLTSFFYGIAYKSSHSPDVEIFLFFHGTIWKWKSLNIKCTVLSIQDFLIPYCLKIKCYWEIKWSWMPTRMQKIFFCYHTKLVDHVSHYWWCKETLIALGPKVAVVPLQQRWDKVSALKNWQHPLNSYQAKPSDFRIIKSIHTMNNFDFLWCNE